MLPFIWRNSYQSTIYNACHVLVDYLKIFSNNFLLVACILSPHGHHLFLNHQHGVEQLTKLANSR